MKNLKQNLFISVLGLALFASPSMAADFTLNIPVEATGLPDDAKEMVASCQIFTDRNSPVVGAGAKTTILTTNSFSGQVAVSITALPSMDPALAQRYRCSVWFQTQTRPGIPNTFYYMPDVIENGTYHRNFPIVPGSVLKLQTGFLPIPR